MAMSGIPSRITQHTLVAVMLLCCGVLAPILLLMRIALGAPAAAVGLGLLAAGCSSVIGAAFSRCFDRSECSAFQWRLMIVSPWLLNPMFVAIAALQCNCSIASSVWWSGFPLATVVSVLTGDKRLFDGDPEWQHQGCPPRMSFIAHWLISRMIFVALPLCMGSLQIAWYLPLRATLPEDAGIGLCVIGICVLVFAKFFSICSCLAHEMLARAWVLAALLAADWTGFVHLFGIIDDGSKEKIVLVLFFVAGVVQLRIALVRLSLRSRWSQVLARRRAGVRDFNGSSSTINVDVELGAHINSGVSQELVLQIESSDSDDEGGPGSLPEGFYETLVRVLGIPPPSGAGARRQFLCGLRSAVVSGEPAQATPPEGTSTVVSTPKPLAQVASSAPHANDTSVAPEEAPAGASSKPPIEIRSDDRVCTVCQDEIRTGDLIRPLPKCPHIFHADCLDRWATTMRESTRCPTCRRPALARRAGDGAVSIQVLTASGNESDSSTASSRSRSTSANFGRGRAETNRTGARPGRGRAGASRSASAGASNRATLPVSGGRGRQGGGGRRGASAAGQPGTRIVRRTQDYANSPAAATLSASLAVSEAMAIAALECSEGAPDVAAHVLLEHKGILLATYPHSAQTHVVVPDGIAEAFVSNNPDLACCQAALESQLSMLYRLGRLPVIPWAELTTIGRVDVFRVALEDVARKLSLRGA
eukprot:TRINITY_DN3354_c0_g2_i1.p1 TRINITY_DN3354_c0_g2~~TRINITY_DN3354_c0_g2_i1.p1  ORF type:complete len:725 (-),score=90.51 TRINITY_DN3354_c0_g2_i1:270-2381(-)